MHSEFPLQNNSNLTRNIVVIGMLFVCLLLVSNICSFKIIEFSITKTFGIELPAAVIFFPLTYLFDDIITEVYGFKMSRLIIWTGNDWVMTDKQGLLMSIK